MDMNFSAPINQDPLLVIHIVDEEWATETLPTEDIELPPSIIPTIEEDDHGAVDEQENEDDKWNDLGLDDFALLASETARPNGSTLPATTPTASSR
ncbi:hypothetical protein FGB62_122g035 [Gracilaria domingensis]|nr:hypothetical protein FGB62_122g035 [Gracilaria domingensis]